MIFFNFFLIQLLHKNEPYGTISVMMEKRSYKKYTDVYQELETFCIQSLKDGSFLLPGERELASRFHVSRLTLEKGEVDIDGRIDSLTYSEQTASAGSKAESLLSRLFR